MNLPKSVRTNEQEIKRTKTVEGHTLVVKIRHDDNCGNGHNTFSITATLTEHGSVWQSLGCLHEKIAEFFPELAQYIKWHLCSTDGPMHYVANTMYLAGDKDCWGKRKGEPASFKTAIKFGDFPITFSPGDAFIEFLRNAKDYNFEIAEVKHKNPDMHRPRFTFVPYSIKKWYACPFDTESDAQEFLVALQNYEPKYISVPTSFSNGKEPELEAARSAAIWPEATHEQLTSKELLLERLPGLMEEFKEAVESLGLIY